MPAITFFTLLSEAHKSDVYEKRFQLTVAKFPHLESDDQETIQQSLQLPDDILGDILIEETDDIATLKEAINNVD